MSAEMFIQSAFGATPTAPVSFSTPNNDPTGATATGMTTVVQGGTNGSKVSQIRVRAVTNTGDGTILYLFYNDGTNRRNIGHIVVTPGKNPAVAGQQPFEGVWTNPNGDGFLKATHKIDIVPFSGNTTFHAWPVGGDY